MLSCLKLLLRALRPLRIIARMECAMATRKSRAPSGLECGQDLGLDSKKPCSFIRAAANRIDDVSALMMFPCSLLAPQVDEAVFRALPRGIPVRRTPASADRRLAPASSMSFACEHFTAPVRHGSGFSVLAGRRRTRRRNRTPHAPHNPERSFSAA